MNEIDSLMRVGSDGVNTHSGNALSLSSRLDEWLETPEGSIYGLPGWGNNLARFKHEPTNVFTEVAIENSVITKLRIDIPELKLIGIRCQELSVDIYKVDFLVPEGIISKSLIKESIK